MPKQWDGKTRVAKKPSKSKPTTVKEMTGGAVNTLAELGQISPAKMFLPILEKGGKQAMNKLAPGLGDTVLQAIQEEGGIKGVFERRGFDWFPFIMGCGVGAGFMAVLFVGMGGLGSFKKMLQ